MAKHSERDFRGRFTKSGAPIDGDPSAYEHVASPSADPLGEHDEPARTVYPPHDFAHGPVFRRIEPRHAVMIDGETGERIAAEVDHELRGLDTLYGGGELRARAHLQAAGQDAFAANLMSRPDYDINAHGHRHMGFAEDADASATHHTWPGEVAKPMRSSGA